MWRLLWITTQIPTFIQVWMRDTWKLCWSLFGLILILRENRYTQRVDIVFPAFIRTPVSLLLDDSLVWHKPSRKQNNYKLCNRQADFVMSWLVWGIVLQCECFLGVRKIPFQKDNLILFFFHQHHKHEWKCWRKNNKQGSFHCLLCEDNSRESIHTETEGVLAVWLRYLKTLKKRYRLNTLHLNLYLYTLYFNSIEIKKSQLPKFYRRLILECG